MRLSRFEFTQLQKICMVLFPAEVDSRIPIGAKDLPLDKFVRSFYGSAPPMLKLSIRAALWLVLLSPIFWLGHAGLITSLPESQQIALLQRIQQHPVYGIRELPFVLKMVACIGFCGVPAVQQACGLTIYDQTPPEWAKDCVAAYPHV